VPTSGRLVRYASSTTASATGSLSSVGSGRHCNSNYSCNSDDFDLCSSGTLSGGGGSREETSSDDDDHSEGGLPRRPQVSSLTAPTHFFRRSNTTGSKTPSRSLLRSRPAISVGSGGSSRRPISLQVQSPFGRVLPPVPDDFMGRSVDLWAILQHLSTRRAVVICGARDKKDNQLVQHGIGKTAVLDALHRTYALHVGGVCVAVPMRALSEVDTVVSKGGWVDKLQSAVRTALQECQEHWWPCGSSGGMASKNAAMGTFRSKLSTSHGNALRRRAASATGKSSSMSTTSSSGRSKDSSTVSRGFHPLSDPIALRPAVEELVHEMALLSDVAAMRRRDFSAASGEVLLLLDECDHLIQQQQFQEAIAEILQRCPSYRIVLSTHQAMVGPAGGHFKVIHQPLSGLPPEDASRLFLRRMQRPLRWEELIPRSSFTPAEPAFPTQAVLRQAMTKVGAQDLMGNVVVVPANEGDVLKLLANHPAIKLLGGNPRRIIELASSAELAQAQSHLSDLVPKATFPQIAAPAPNVDSEVDLR